MTYVSKVVGKLFGVGQQKVAQAAPLPTAPAPQDAALDASAELTKKRKRSLLSGGKTDLTEGKAQVTGANIGKQTLGGQ